MKKFTLKEFGEKKRELLLDYKVYAFNFDEMIEGFEIVRKSPLIPPHELNGISAYDLVVPLEQRALDSLTFLLTCYSGGHDIADLREIYPTVLSYWSSYAEEWASYQKSDQCTNNTVAAVALQGSDFVYANQLICFGILLGWGDELTSVIPIIDFNNDRRDGMLERLLGPYLSGRGDPPDESTRHLPYFKTFKIFDAIPAARADLMKEYLGDWYSASRRERYYDSHKRGATFKGYWSWEAAAITYILDIDDSSYQDAKFYPADLVQFALDINAPRARRPEADGHILRVKSGEQCPKSGPWESLDIPPQRRDFFSGEIMFAKDANYGITVWRYVGNQ